MREHDALEHNPQVSRQALEALHGQLYGWALSRCGYDEVEAWDLMQTAYVEILSGRARFDNKSTLKTFVFGIVQNPGGSHEDCAAQADHRERDLIWKAVESLPQRQRDITELVFCREMTVEEASQVMGITVGTGRVHYDRAKKALAGALAELKQRESGK